MLLIICPVYRRGWHRVGVRSSMALNVEHARTTKAAGLRSMKWSGAWLREGIGNFCVPDYDVAARLKGGIERRQLFFGELVLKD